MADDLVQEISEDLLKCAICMERYEKPKILPCFHTFCESCLDLYSQKKGNTFPCPSCRKEVKLSEEGVQGLPANFYVGNLNEKMTRLEELQSQAEKEAEVRCSDCGSLDVRTDHICIKCERVFCDSCAGDHSRFSLINGHKVLLIEEFKKQMKEKDFLKPDKDPSVEMCAKHPKEQAGLYCDTCKMVICFRCTEETHSRPDHDYKSLRTQCARTAQLVSNMPTESEAMLQDCSDLAAARLHSLQRIRENASHYKQLVSSESKKKKKAIEDEERKLLTEIEKFEKRVFHFYKVRIDEISDWRESVEVSHAAIKRLQTKSSGKAEFLNGGHYLGETFSNMQKQHFKFQECPEVEQLAFVPLSAKAAQGPSLGKIWIPKCLGMKATGNGSRDVIVLCEDAASFDIHIGNALSENGLHLKNIFWFVCFSWPPTYSHLPTERKEGKVCFAVNPGNCVFLGQGKTVACFDMIDGTSRQGRDGDICYRTISDIRCMDYDESSMLLFIGVSSTRIVAVNPERNWSLSFYIEILSDLYSPLSLCPHKYGALFVCESQSMVYQANFKRQCGFLASCPTAIGGQDFKPVDVFRTLCSFSGNERTTDGDLYQVGRKQGHYPLKQASAQLEFQWFVLWVSASGSVPADSEVESVPRWAIAEYNTDNTNAVAILSQPAGMSVPTGIVAYESDGFMELTLCDKSLDFKVFKRSRRTGTTASPLRYQAL